MDQPTPLGPPRRRGAASLDACPHRRDRVGSRSMSRLASISASRYRSFARRTTLDLRPITLIYGRNSAGKSALLRLLPLVGDSVGPTASSPLELSRVVGHRASFRDVVWKGPIEGPRDIGLDLGWSEATGIDETHYRLRYSDERRKVIVEELQLLQNSTPRFVGRRIPESRDRERAGAPLLYDVTVPEPAPPEPWTFTGLIPSPTTPSDTVGQAARLLTDLRGRIQWLCSLRRPPQRRNPDSGSAPVLLSADGSDTCDALRADDDLRADVSAWYEEHTGRLIELQDAPPDDYRVLLRPADMPGMDIDLVDASEGLIQVFSVLTALQIARRRATQGPFFLAIEEPESHLHPDYQTALARAFCAVAASETPPVIVLETHSSQLLLTVQIEVARGALPPDRVAIFWIEQSEDGSSTAVRVSLDEGGFPDVWPPGVFADQRRLALELQQVRSTGRSGGTARGLLR